jgi:hypothetical protein
MNLSTTCPMKDARVTANPIEDTANSIKVKIALPAIR